MKPAKEREKIRRREDTPGESQPRERDRQRARAYWTLERMKREWEIREWEMRAVRKAVQYVATSTSAFRKLVRYLYGVDPDEMDTDQRQRTDKLLYTLQRVAKREGQWPTRANRRQTNLPDEKECAACGETKPLEKYPVWTYGSDGRRNKCEPCYREQRAA